MFAVGAVVLVLAVAGALFGTGALFSSTDTASASGTNGHDEGAGRGVDIDPEPDAEKTGGKPDEAVRVMFEASGSNDCARLIEVTTDKMRSGVTAEKCERLLASREEPEVDRKLRTARTVEEDGTKAVVDATVLMWNVEIGSESDATTGKGTYDLVKEDGRWKVDGVRTGDTGATGDAGESGPAEIPTSDGNGLSPNDVPSDVPPSEVLPVDPDDVPQLPEPTY